MGRAVREGLQSTEGGLLEEEHGASMAEGQLREAAGHVTLSWPLGAVAAARRFRRSRVLGRTVRLRR